MQPRPPYMENPDKYEIATEVLSSAIRVLQAAGFHESEILQLFAQVSNKRERTPLWLTPITDAVAAPQDN
jgi:DNA-binding transcriptional regulator YhcF (GntR family)